MQAYELPVVHRRAWDLWWQVADMGHEPGVLQPLRLLPQECGLQSVRDGVPLGWDMHLRRRCNLPAAFAAASLAIAAALALTATATPLADTTLTASTLTIAAAVAVAATAFPLAATTFAVAATAIPLAATAFPLTAAAVALVASKTPLLLSPFYNNNVNTRACNN